MSRFPVTYVRYGYNPYDDSPPPTVYGMDENSPEEMDLYRRWYAEKMSALLADGATAAAAAAAAADTVTKSHILGAVWEAVLCPLSADAIVRMIFNRALPQDADHGEKEGEGEGEDCDEPLCFYEVALDLADGVLAEAKETRIRKALGQFFGKGV